MGVRRDDAPLRRPDGPAARRQLHLSDVREAVRPRRSRSRTSRAAATRPARRACCGRCCSHRSGRSARAVTRSSGSRSACARALYARVGVGCYRFVRVVPASESAGSRAAVMVLVIAPFAWCALSGMEVAFAAALLVATLLLLVRERRGGRRGAARRVSRRDLAVAARGDAARRWRSSASRRSARCVSATGAPPHGGSSPLAPPIAVAAREPADRRQLLPEHRRREEPLLSAGLRLDVLVGERARPLAAACCKGLFWDEDEPARVAALDRCARPSSARCASASGRGARSSSSSVRS